MRLAMARLTPLISAEAIAARVAELGARITRDYRQRKLLLVGVLDGAFVFLADLCRHIDLPLECDFVCVQSYGGATESNGRPVLTRDITRPIAARDVLIVQDIVDTGLTADFLCKLFGARARASLALCTLLRKKGRAIRDVSVDYLGFEVPDRFIVGYGLDHAQRHRNLAFASLEQLRRLPGRAHQPASKPAPES
jgi:hypoxanthine phosphoribosyltransferase